MSLQTHIDSRIPQPTAVNQILVWNPVTGLLEASVSLSGLTLNSPVIAGDFSWTILGFNNTLDASDGGKIIKIDPTSTFSFAVNTRPWLNLSPSDNAIIFGNNDENPAYVFGGTGLTTLGGNILVNGGFIGDTDDPSLIEIDGAGGIVTVGGSLIVNNTLFIADSVTNTIAVGSAADEDVLFLMTGTKVPTADFTLLGGVGSILSNTNPNLNFSGIDYTIEVDGSEAVGVMSGIKTSLSVSTNFSGLTVSEACGVCIESLSFEAPGRGTLTVSDVYNFKGVNSTGTGITTNLYGLYLPDMTGGVNNWAIKTGLGKVEFGGDIGFFATSAVSQNQLATGTGATVDDVITELQRLGLVRQVA